MHNRSIPYSQVAEKCSACVVLSDMALPGAPMVYVSKLFCTVTGYSQRELLGQNCRLLQAFDRSASMRHTSNTYEIAYVSQLFCAVTGYSQRELRGPELSDAPGPIYLEGASTGLHTLRLGARVLLNQFRSVDVSTYS